jgi:hypothetical protein
LGEKIDRDLSILENFCAQFSLGDGLRNSTMNISLIATQSQCREKVQPIGALVTFGSQTSQFSRSLEPMTAKGASIHGAFAIQFLRLQFSFVG